jgi:NADP-dependent 3-hydroxy acid dehydrogenase YdfG
MREMRTHGLNERGLETEPWSRDRSACNDGEDVYATMRDVQHRNASSARQLGAWAATSQYPLHVVELDVTNDASVESAVGSVIAAEGQIDVVVNNAGVSAWGPLEAFSVAQMANLLDINVLGAMRVNQAVLPTMRARRSGAIIWITSGLVRVLPNLGGLYPATKWQPKDSLNPFNMRFDHSTIRRDPGARHH